MVQTLRIMVISAIVLAAAAGCSEPSPDPVVPADPNLQQMCIWLANLRKSEVMQDVTAENLESIGRTADALATESGQFLLKGDAQASLGRATIVLQNIKEAARDERGLTAIPTFKSILGEEIGHLLLTVTAVYALPPNQAVCAAYDA